MGTCKLCGNEIEALYKRPAITTCVQCTYYSTLSYVFNRVIIQNAWGHDFFQIKDWSRINILQENTQK